MTDTNQLPPLPDRLCIDDDKAEFSTDQMRAYALQAIAKTTQPAEVTLDEVMQAAKKATAPEWQDVIDGWHMGLDLMAFARAILALRPVQVPMTDEEITAIEESVWRMDWFDQTERESNREFVRAIEAHHGITAQAKKEQA